MQVFPLVSLIIISYNQRAYIHDCMNSLLALTYPNIQILYLDDCSPDNTYEAALKYEDELKRKYEKVLFCRNRSNQGLIKNLNRLVMESQGAYVKFMSADDFLFANAIDLVVACMEEHTEYDMLYTNGIFGGVDIHFPLESMSGMERLYYGEQMFGKGLFSKLYQRDFIAAPTVVIRRNVYDRLGLYDERIGIEDWDFYLRVAEQGCIGYIDEITVMYRFINESLSHSDHPIRRMNMQKSTLLIREKYRDKIENAQEVINRSFNDAFQDAVHIDNTEYFVFLREYAARNYVKITAQNRIRYLLYRMHIFTLLELRGK